MRNEGSQAPRDGEHGPIHDRVRRHVIRQSIVLNCVESSPAQPLVARPAPPLRSLTLFNPPARPNSSRIRVLPAAPFVMSDHGDVVVERIPHHEAPYDVAMRRQRVQLGREVPQLDERVVVGNQPKARSRKDVPTVLKVPCNLLAPDPLSLARQLAINGDS